MTGQSESETDVIEFKDIKEYEPKKKRPKVEQKLVCSYDNCNAVFKRLYRLKRHLRQHTGERPFLCPIKGCLRSFTCKTYLSKHLKRPHNTQIDGNKNNEVKPVAKPAKQYICSDCQKIFKTKYQLRIHCFQHSGQKPFECNKCEKRFVSQTKLKSHMKTHDGYVCGRDGCDYKTSKWSELRKHRTVEHKISFKCDICFKILFSEYNLNVHKETTHYNPNDKFVCFYDNCSKSYSRKSNLMTHIRAEHEKQVFNCTEDGCLKTFLHKKTLNRHLESHSKPKKEIQKTKTNICQKKVSEASKLTGIILTAEETQAIMASDLRFRQEVLNPDNS